MAMRLDQPGDPYRCCLCPNRSRAHLCRRCYATHADPEGNLPEWLLALQRDAARQAMRLLRAYRAGGPVDAQALAAHELIIARDLPTFRRVGGALASIRDERLYRETHRTFEEYCRAHWSLPRAVERLVYRIDRAEIAEDAALLVDAGYAAAG